MGQNDKKLIELDSVFEYSSIENRKYTNNYRNLLMHPISFNMTLDKAMISLESSILAYYAYMNYPDDLLECDTLSTDSNRAKYMEKVSAASEKKGCSCGQTKKKNKVCLAQTYAWRQDRLPIKKCSDILAFIEFYMNRLTSVNDNTIKTNMISARDVLLKIVENERIGYDKDLKDSPLRFGSDENKEICVIRSDVFADGEAKGFYHLIKALGLFDDDSDGEHPKAFIRLDGSVKELDDMYDSYWGDDDQRNASNRYIPLDILVGYLMKIYAHEPEDEMCQTFFRTMAYSIDEDIRDFEHFTITPMDPFLGRVGSRDDDFETSHSLTSEIYRCAPDYCRRVLAFARILHGIIMDARPSSNDQTKFSFIFNPETNLLKMMDPRMFDRNYPPLMVFCGDTEKEMEEYGQYLSSTKGYRRMDDNRNCFERLNKEHPIAVNWPNVAGNTNNIHERNKEKTIIDLMHVDRGNIDELCSIVNSDSKNNHVIIVTNWRSLSYTEHLVADIKDCVEKIDYIAVLDRYNYLSIRHDFFDVIEIGVDSIEGLYRLHKNDADIRRKAIIETTLSGIERYVDIEDGTGKEIGERIDRLKRTIDARSKENTLIYTVLRSYLGTI